MRWSSSDESLVCCTVKVLVARCIKAVGVTSGQKTECVWLRWLISSPVVECNTSPSSWGGFPWWDPSECEGPLRDGEQWWGGPGTASESNRRASVSVCMSATWAYKAFWSVPLMDPESSPQGLSFHNSSAQRNSFKEGTGSQLPMYWMCYSAIIF